MKNKIPFIIAEIGINHNGSLDLAKQLIDQAVTSGCDAVKFQKRTINKVYTHEYLAEYRESPWGTTQREQKEGLEFGKEEYDEIDIYCKQNNILWSASAWDCESQEFLRQYDLKFNKIASAMITCEPLLKLIAKERKPTYISTGMSSYDDIDRAVNIFRHARSPFMLLHCVSTYPTRDDDSNLKVIAALKKKYGCDVGYSGHEEGILPSLIAVALGATAIERHITLDKTLYGSDQSASLEPNDFAELVKIVKNIPNILGDGEKRILDSEKPIAKKLRYWM